MARYASLPSGLVILGQGRSKSTLHELRRGNEAQTTEHDATTVKVLCDDSFRHALERILVSIGVEDWALAAPEPMAIGEVLAPAETARLAWMCTGNLPRLHNTPH